MKISCPSCAAKYSITDEKVRDRLAKIRCRKCGTTIVIDGKVDPPEVTAAAPTTATQEASADAGYGGSAEAGPLPGDYSVDMGDDDQRSMSVQQIVEAYRRGEISDTTYVWADGMIDWQRIADVTELSSALGLRASVAPPESQPPSSRAAMRSGAGRGSATDLFGGIESAGSEDDVTTSAPEPMAAPAATGARNESSVLFSLSALTGSATPTAPIAVAAPSFPSKAPAPVTRASIEDSGLIDLKALTAAVPGAGSDMMMAPGSPLNLGAPPLGMAAPLGGVGAAIPATDNLDSGRRSGGKGALIVGGAILIVGLAAVLAFTMRDGAEEAKPETAAAVPATTAAAPTQTARPATPPPVKTAEPVAEPPPTGTVAATPPPTTQAPTPTPATAARPSTASTSGTVAKRKPTTPTPSGSAPSSSSSSSTSSSSSSTSSASTPTPAPAEPKPAKKKCDCKPSDLMCAMKCSAK